MSKNAVDKKIETTAGEVHRDILKRRKPSLKFPLRSLSNVKYDPKEGHFQMRGRTPPISASLPLQKNDAAGSPCFSAVTHMGSPPHQRL